MTINAAAERAIRPLALDRQNQLFVAPTPGRSGDPDVYNITPSFPAGGRGSP